ncbi:MAG: hypothetical protein AAF899_13650 [Pseudomonadota bacterium]
MRRVAFGAMALLLLGTAASKAEDGLVTVELNKLQDEGTACQAFMLLQNTTPLSFEALALDLVMFDREGIISRRLAVEMAPLRAGKTTVKVFSMDGLECTGIGRILLNDVVTCTADTEAPDCLGLITTASRADAEFVK